MYQPARHLLFALGFAIAATMSAIAPAAQAQTINAAASQPKYAAIVVDARTGEVMYAKRADSIRYPASITKVMTLYLTFEALAAGKIKLDDRVVFSPRAAAQAPTKLGVPAGQSISVSEAMQAMAIKSANDAAVAMAEKLGGTEARFAAMMTLRAQELGMYNTHYANANGLPDSRQLTTARDLAILTRAVMRDYPQYYKLFSQESFTFRGQTMRNHNHLLFRMPGVDGVKTGYTNASGYNLAVSAVRGNRRLIAVVLGGSSGAVRDNNAEDLLLTGFDVMGRRDRGEKIEVAQNMFEPEPVGGRIQPSIEQGDVEQEGLNVILARATDPKRVSNVKIVDPSTTALKKGKWAVQVGSFKTKSDAKEQISFVSKRFSSHFKSANGVADKAGRGYRARFGGFTEASAKSACKDMKAKRLACMVVAPG